MARGSKGTVSPVSGVILVSAVEPSKLVEKVVLFSERRVREWSQDCSALGSAVQRMHVPVWEKWDAPSKPNLQGSRQRGRHSNINPAKPYEKKGFWLHLGRCYISTRSHNRNVATSI